MILFQKHASGNVQGARCFIIKINESLTCSYTRLRRQEEIIGAFHVILQIFASDKICVFPAVGT